MKSFVSLTLFVAIASLAAASSVGSSTSSVSSDSIQDAESDLKPVHTSQLNKEYSRFRKSAGYGGFGDASIPALPCPKNYVFSCQPNLAPVPCSGPGYGSAGAFSAPVPSYVSPLGSNYGFQRGYDGLVPQTFNNFYQY